MNYTVVKPSWKFIDRYKEGYLKFLEECCRTCYKSEDKIKKGSAEKLLTKIINKNHVSVLEHESCIMKLKFNSWELTALYLLELYQSVPMFALRASNPIVDTQLGVTNRVSVILSGNIRMWKELVESKFLFSEGLWNANILYCLNNLWIILYIQ